MILVYFPPLKSIEGGWRLMTLSDIRMIIKYNPNSLKYLDIIDCFE